MIAIAIPRTNSRVASSPLAAPICSQLRLLPATWRGTLAWSPSESPGGVVSGFFILVTSFLKQQRGEIPLATADQVPP